jgi:hypothetical protein
MPGSSYLDLVRGLPRPTEAQVETFVVHVADAENWLKSLVPPRDTSRSTGAARLVPFLDPTAGARVNLQRATGRYGVELLEPGAELLHGSELPTREYRAAHGHLNYYTDLGAGTAELDGDLLRRAHLPGPGVVWEGGFVPLDPALEAHACRPGPFLHGTFRAPHDEGSLRRFRFAVERLPRLEGMSREDPLVCEVEAWSRRCKAEDEAAFAGWLAAAHAESPAVLAEPQRWQRYIEWRDEEACTAMHREQDETFRQSGIPEQVLERHAHSVRVVLDATRAMLAHLDALRR